MRDNDTSEATKEQRELQPELDSPTEDLVYAQDVDWDQETMLSSLIDEDMVKEIASQLARATAESEEDRAGGESSSDSGDADADDESSDEMFDDSDESGDEETDDDHDEYGDLDAHEYDDEDLEEPEDYDQEALDDIIEDILDDRARVGVAEAAAFAESRLAAGQDLRVLDRYGPPTAGVGLVVLGVTLAVAFGVGMIVEHEASYFFSPVAMTVSLTVLLGSFAYLLCRSWFKQAWEHRNHVIDAAAATVLELESNPATRSDETRRLFEESSNQLYSQMRAELDERTDKLREDTHRDVEKMRIFFESLLEKHVKRLNDELREKTALIEKLQLKKEDGEKTDAEVVRLTKENERLKTQLEDLETELDQVDKDRRFKEDEIEDLRQQVAKSDRSRDGDDRERVESESAAENEELKTQLSELKADLEAKSRECRILTEEIDDAVRGADGESRASLDLFDKVSGQLTRNLQLASKLATQLGEDSSADSESSLTTEIRGHLANLERLISQIVDLGKIQSPDWTTESSEVRLKDLLHECVERVRSTADQSGIKISVRAAKDLPKVSTDRRLVARAVDELVANAVVYTNPGGRVTVRARLDEDDPDTLCLVVQDNGQGMTKSELKSIFEPFERGKHPRLSLSGAGAGLGLALAKGYAEKLGGEIEVDSKQGKGSTFTLRLPVDLAS